MLKENSQQAYAIGKSLKTSPQKAMIVLQEINGKKVDKALNILEFSRRKISMDVLKILKSAVSNAENNHQLDIDKLFVKEASVGKSMVLKRFRPRARGRAGKILKPFSRVRILVEERKEDKVSSKKNNEDKNQKQKNNLKKQDDISDKVSTKSSAVKTENETKIKTEKTNINNPIKENNGTKN